MIYGIRATSVVYDRWCVFFFFSLKSAIYYGYSVNRGGYKYRYINIDRPRELNESSARPTECMPCRYESGVFPLHFAIDSWESLLTTNNSTTVGFSPT